MVPHRLVVLFGRLLESSVWDSSSVVSTNAQAATLLLLQISRFFMEPIHFSLTSKTLNFDSKLKIIQGLSRFMGTLGLTERALVLATKVVPRFQV